jgi:hypothetical protein
MRFFFLLLLTASAALAQTYTNPIGTVQHTNGRVVSPPDFWTANSNSINAVVAGGGGGSSDWSTISNKPSWISTNAANSLTNLGLGATNDVTFARVTVGNFAIDILDDGRFTFFGDDVLQFRTNRIDVSKPLQFEGGELTAGPTRTNLGLGASWLTNSNPPVFLANTNPLTNGQVLTVGGEFADQFYAGTLPLPTSLRSDAGEEVEATEEKTLAYYTGAGVWRIYNPERFREELSLGYLGTNAATTVSNLFASNSLPSGAASIGTPALADGSGGTAFATPTSWTVASGTITSNVTALNVSQTWNSATSVFTPVSVSVSNVNNTNASQLFSATVNGTNFFQVRSSDGYIGGPSAGIATRGTASFNRLALVSQGNPVVLYNSGNALHDSSAGIGWVTSGAPSSLALDTATYRDGAGSIAQRNGTNAQTSNIYGTYTASTNYRRLSVGISNNGIGFIRPEQAGPSTNTNNVLHISGFPTNTSGLGSGVLWNSNGVPCFTP